MIAWYVWRKFVDIFQVELFPRVLTNNHNVSYCNSTGCYRNGENVKTLQSKRPLSVPLSESFFRHTKVKNKKPPKLSSFQEQRKQSKHNQLKNQIIENETEELEDGISSKTAKSNQSLSVGNNTVNILDQNEPNLKTGKN